MEGAEVVPIFAKAASENSNNRPISLTSVPSNVMESLSRDQLLGHMRQQGFLKEAQHGLLPRRSWVDEAYLDFAETFTPSSASGSSNNDQATE